jgi:hypothetical protein
VVSSEDEAAFLRQIGVGALGVCFLVILPTFPVMIPFIVCENVQLALRICNAVAVVSLLFFASSFLRVIPAFGPGRRVLYWSSSAPRWWELRSPREDEIVSTEY